MIACSLRSTAVMSCLVLGLWGLPADAQFDGDPVDSEEAEDISEGGAQGQSADEVARELANPNNSLASLTFKNQYRWYDGDLPMADDQSNYSLLFQPVFPFNAGQTSSGGNANIFVRPAFPLLVDQPVFDRATGGFGDVTGMGDIPVDFAYGATEPSGFLWAAGVLTTFPTATRSDLGSGRYTAGPNGLAAQFEDWGVYGLQLNHQWDYAGWSDRDISVTAGQGFLVALPGGGWSYGSTPQFAYDWESDEWTVPLNATVSKTVVLGDLPLKLQAEVNYYVLRPDAFASEWMVGINITPVVPNFIEAWLD